MWKDAMKLKARREKDDKKMEEVMARHAEAMAIGEEVRMEIAKLEGEEAKEKGEDAEV